MLDCRLSRLELLDRLNWRNWLDGSGILQRRKVLAECFVIQPFIRDCH